MIYSLFKQGLIAVFAP